MASRIIAQLLVAGGAAFFRAAAQAWQQALVNAQKTGVAQEGLKAASSRAKMSVQEAKLVLGVEANASWADVLKKYDYLFEANQKNGSFYLQSKVYRAKEALEEEYEQAGTKTDEPPEKLQQ